MNLWYLYWLERTGSLQIWHLCPSYLLKGIADSDETQGLLKKFNYTTPLKRVMKQKP